MSDIAGIPYFKVDFDKNGVFAALPAIPNETTDLFVISHGWNNNAAEADNLYRTLFTNFSAVAKSFLIGKKLCIVGVFWPSKAFDELVAVERDSGDGGGAASIGAGMPDPQSEAALDAKLTRMKTFFGASHDNTIESMRALIPQLELSDAVRMDFVELARTLLNRSAADREDGSSIFFKVDASDLMDRLRITADDVDEQIVTGGGAASLTGPGAPPPDVVGRAAGIGEWLQGFKTSAMNVLNYTTYYEMKARAGIVGSTGVAVMIDALDASVKNIHLIGHSFGGRVVTAAAADSHTEKIRSMSLLQAAFSHNGFSAIMQGAFRNVVDRKRVKGPILVTHTINDKAVGVAYPIASRLAGQNAATLGDASDPFGGLGRNGAQRMNTGEVIIGELLDVNTKYPFQPGKFLNARADRFISNHGDVATIQVAYAIAAASLAD
jgi:hypothetical protein